MKNKDFEIANQEFNLNMKHQDITSNQDITADDFATIGYDWGNGIYVWCFIFPWGIF